MCFNILASVLSFNVHLISQFVMSTSAIKPIYKWLTKKVSTFEMSEKKKCTRKTIERKLIKNWKIKWSRKSVFFLFFFSSCVKGHFKSNDGNVRSFVRITNINCNKKKRTEKKEQTQVLENVSCHAIVHPIVRISLFTSPFFLLLSFDFIIFRIKFICF